MAEKTEAGIAGAGGGPVAARDWRRLEGRVAGDSPEYRPLGAAQIVAGLLGEAVLGAGYALFHFLVNWVLFPDGRLFWKVRGRLYTWLFGWGRGVGVARFVTARDARSIRVGPYTRINEGAILMGPLRIGSHCWIGERDVIYPETTIGDRVGIGPLVYIITQWHEIGPPHRRTGELKVKPVRIGDGANINGGAMIMAGCDVGDGSVVMGGAKVTRKVPPHVVVAGNPAVIVRRLEAAP